jgi:hypothetical protein
MATVRPNTCLIFPLAAPDPFKSDQKVQDTVRNKESGRGYLHNDTFAEERLILLPPASSAILIIFCRNHNYICDTLLKINERGRWRDPKECEPQVLAQQDEEIFQTARLVKYASSPAFCCQFLTISRAWQLRSFHEHD